MVNLEEYRKRASSDYHKAADATADIVVEALCMTYHFITGKKASDQMRDAFYYAVRFDA